MNFAVDLIFSSLSVRLNESQLFQPIGGVAARTLCWRLTRRCAWTGAARPVTSTKSDSNIVNKIEKEGERGFRTVGFMTGDVRGRQSIRQ